MDLSPAAPPPRVDSVPPNDEPPILVLPEAPAAPNVALAPPRAVLVVELSLRPELLLDPPDEVRPPVAVTEIPPELCRLEVELRADVPPVCPYRGVVLPPLDQLVIGDEPPEAPLVADVLLAPPVGLKPPNAVEPPKLDFPERVEPPTELSSTTIVPPQASDKRVASKAHRLGQIEIMTS